MINWINRLICFIFGHDPDEKQPLSDGYLVKCERCGIIKFVEFD